jgi:hypothetical protein
MSDRIRHTLCLEVSTLFRPCVISDARREMKALKSFRATRQAPSPNLGRPHSLLLAQQVRPRRSPIVSKKSSRCRSAAPCCYRVFCIFCNADLGHGTSNTCPYIYRNSPFPLSFFSGSLFSSRQVGVSNSAFKRAL